MLKVDELLEIKGEVGRVCYTTTYEDRDYAWIAFYDETNNSYIYKVFETKEENEKILTKEIEDTNILEKITSDYVANIVEKKGITDDFLAVYDEE